MVTDLESFKESIKSNLELNFIERKEHVEKEMNMINVLISLYKGGNEFSYDEYCRSRMKFELEACDSLDVEFDLDEVSEKEEVIIHGKVQRRFMSNPTNDPNEILKDVFSDWQANKICEFEKKAYHHIIKHSSVEMLKEKLGDTYENKKDYFDDICESRAKSHAEATAENNKAHYKEVIKDSLV